MKNMEQFRDITGYEGMYAVSNKGRVKSLNYRRSGEECIMKPNEVRGYLRIGLWKDGKRKFHQLHRLVAQAFIDNPDNKPEVNHKDEDKTNNFVFVNEDGSVDYKKSNLEWVTAKENTNYGTRNKRAAETKSIPVDMLIKQGEFIRQFHSITEATRWLRNNGFSKATHANIIQCCKGNRNTHCGFKWRYAKGN